MVLTQRNVNQVAKQKMQTYTNNCSHLVFDAAKIINQRKDSIFNKCAKKIECPHAEK